MLNLDGIPLPKFNPRVMSASHNSHALGFGLEAWVQQKPSNEPSGIVCSHIQQNEAICQMREIPSEEVAILREERNSPALMHQREISESLAPSREMSRPI